MLKTDIAGCSNVKLLQGMYWIGKDAADMKAKGLAELAEVRRTSRMAIACTNTNGQKQANDIIREAGGYLVDRVTGNHGDFINVWVIPGLRDPRDHAHKGPEGEALAKAHEAAEKSWWAVPKKPKKKAKRKDYKALYEALVKKQTTKKEKVAKAKRRG